MQYDQYRASLVNTIKTVGETYHNITDGKVILDWNNWCGITCYHFKGKIYVGYF